MPRTTKPNPALARPVRPVHPRSDTDGPEVFHISSVDISFDPIPDPDIDALPREVIDRAAAVFQRIRAPGRRSKPEAARLARTRRPSLTPTRTSPRSGTTWPPPSE